MSEQRLRGIVSDMEVPLRNLGELCHLVCRLLEQCPRSDVLQASILSIIERNLSADQSDLQKLWNEVHRLVFQDTKKTALKAVKE